MKHVVAYASNLYAKLTPRIDYIFKQICSDMLGIDISFTSEIESLFHNKPKISYGKIP